MSIGTNLFARDLARMVGEPAPQLGGRVSTDPQVLSDAEFYQRHGMSRDDYTRRATVLNRRAFEQDAVEDLDKALDGLTGSAADKYAEYHGMLTSEQSKLAELQRKSASLEAVIAAPAESESAIRAAIRRTADAFLAGKSADESDADKRSELDARLAAHKHRAEAAKLALEELAEEIDAQQIRCRRVAEREREFLVPVIFDAVAKSGLVKRWQKARAEMIATETLLRALRQSFTAPVGHDYPWEAPREATPSTHEAQRQWKAIADALRANPRAKVEVPS